jgi:hypothetical protein
MIFLDSSYEDSNRFLFWSWEIWSIGGGAGCVWKFLKWEINIRRYNPLWLVFYWQRRDRK